MRTRIMVYGIAGMMLALGSITHAQEKCVRIMRQDSTLNNLVDPTGYKTAALGSLGAVRESGTGQQAVILIPGLGFGADVFDELMTRWDGQYRMFAVTLPGFGGTPAPPCPATATSFGDQTWTNGAVAGIEKLIAEKQIENPIILGHWLTGPQIAVRLANKHPGRIRGVIIVAGAAKMIVTDTSYAKYYATPEMRVATVDNFMGPRWFKTVTRETWDDNNFLPTDYAVNPLRGLRMWREAFSPDLHVWVRYLCEFNAQDLAADVNALTVPTLIIKPGLEGLPLDSPQNYMYAYTHTSWGEVSPSASVTFATIPNTRVGIWFDQPEKFDAEVTAFVNSLK